MDNNINTVNADEILKEIDAQTIKELESNQKDIDENFNEVAKKRAGIMKQIYYAMFSKLLSKLKIKITCYWGDRVIFEYVIPKN